MKEAARLDCTAHRFSVLILYSWPLILQAACFQMQAAFYEGQTTMNTKTQKLAKETIVSEETVL